VGGRAMVEQLETRARLNDGFVIEYAKGLNVGDYRGVREVSHGGSTAGYQTFLARWPDERLSVAVLCNTTGTDPDGYAHQVADLFLAGKLKAIPTVEAADVPADTFKDLAGVYHDKLTDGVIRVFYDAKTKALRVGGSALVPIGTNELSTADGSRTFAIDTKGAGGGVRLTESRGGQSKPRVWEREPPFEPTPQQLIQFAGDYVCEELGGLVYTVYVEGNALKVRARPAQRFTLAPLFPDAFTGEGQMIRFTRDAKGRVEGFRVYAGRVRNLRFAKRS
jgi:hypothetical protein